ncbi:uncharacterized protein C8Q71DRAFT_697129 [Rhodofomes roseus]|uniref:Ubiquitin-like-conjugating enzyme ATG10 n=1 Tax=Rhodofomes roseus TaxID=34475 RepID=A0ABQ8KYH9_9APHY|nr:uncharacterized protein C8Q71DRAFT_697129 [Rhodofomes roseus]KAH9843816.1 hypothetical protein C8Q71DRAFT_697129 [Rhodofomes roseus]
MFASLSRAQFEAACKAYIAAHSTQSVDAVCTFAIHPSGWTWNEHQYVPGLGYMSRFVPLSLNASEASSDKHEDYGLIPDDSEDEAAVSESREALTCTQSVVFSPTFQVPAFYFTIHRSNGAPLSLKEIIASPLLRPHTIPGSEATTFALSEQAASFPLLSQGDHPAHGTPAWYFHPCHTQEAVGEIMTEVPLEGWAEDRVLCRWLEAWFMVVGQIADLQCGHA